MWCDVFRPVSSRKAEEDREDLSARSGGSGPRGGTDDPALLLLFSSLVWQGWFRLWPPSPLTETETGDGESKQTPDRYKEEWSQEIGQSKGLFLFLVTTQEFLVTPSKKVITHTRYKEKQEEILKTVFGDLKFSCNDLVILKVVAPPTDKRCKMHAPLNDV